jgi:hypothetical protein
MTSYHTLSLRSYINLLQVSLQITGLGGVAP